MANILKFQEFMEDCNKCAWYAVFACNGKPIDGMDCPYLLYDTKEANQIIEAFNFECEEACEPIKEKYKSLYQTEVLKHFRENKGDEGKNG